MTSKRRYSDIQRCAKDSQFHRGFEQVCAKVSKSVTFRHVPHPENNPRIKSCTSRWVYLRVGTGLGIPQGGNRTGYTLGVTWLGYTLGVTWLGYTLGVEQARLYPGCRAG